MKIKDKIINALYGLAVCDAVGNSFEFQKNINPKDVLDYARSSEILTVSDDTQMTLFGFEAIHSIFLFQKNNQNISSFDIFKEYFTQSYLDWYKTQTESRFDFPSSPNQLLDFQTLWSVQSPGYTCLRSLKDINNGISIDNNSKGCGSVMRILPILSLSEICDFKELIEFGQITGNITHTHYENNIAIDKYIKISHAILYGTFFIKLLFIDHLSRIYDIKNKNIGDYGEGWTALSCVDMGIYAFLKANTFDELLQISISHDGDSAAAGSLWGLSGKDIPKYYIEKLDVIDAIEWSIDNLI